MVAKKFIIKLMEEFLGEYIINIGKENLQVAVIRGKLKLDNVQLDGDLIGSHVLGAVGLQGFAVISCTAAHLRASIPWSKLEKEPTKFELVGLQLVCVPLLTSNALQMHGAGTAKDPRCTLRTRVKRSAIARFERNFFSWRIPGEGPPRPNMDEQQQQQQQQQQKKRRNRKRGTEESAYSKRTANTTIEDDNRSYNSNADDIKDDVSEMSGCSMGDGPEQEDENPQGAAWREKLIQKLIRNLEISIKELHVRCEVGRGALNSGPKQQNEFHSKKKKRKKDSLNDESAFSFGIQFESLVLQSANSSWEKGRNVDFMEKKNQKKETISLSGKENVIQDTKYKVFQAKKMSMYWDDSPPVIISECPLLQSHSDSHKTLSIIRLALDKMKEYQDPGREIHNLLMGKKETKDKKGRPKSADTDSLGSDVPQIFNEHSYVLLPSAVEVRLTLRNLGLPEPSHCQAELMPCKLGLNFNPKQMRQYRALQYAVFAQKRLDTMLQQRPKKSPIKDPRAWWRYAISCVTTHPNARPWREVKQICTKRSRYIELVEKKHLNKDYGALSVQESSELFVLEDLLPIETLLAFHLLALRNVVEFKAIEKNKKSKRSSSQKKSSTLDTSNNSVSPSRRRRRSSSRQRKSKQYDDRDDSVPLNTNKRSTSRKSRHSNNNPPATPRTIDVVSSYDASDSLHENERNKIPLTPTKSPLPRNPGRGSKSKRKNAIASPSPPRIRKVSSGIADDEISLTQSIDSVASLELDAIIKGLDSPSKKFDFSLEGVTISGFDDEDDDEAIESGMQKTIRCHGLSLVITVMNKRNDQPILKANLNASTWIHQIPGEGITFLFDTKNLEFVDCANEYSSKLVTFEVPDNQQNKDRFFSAGIMVPLDISNNNDDDVFLETFCNQMRDGELALPPKGVVSRILISERPNGRSFSLSAHAATMVWNKRCIDALMGTFFPSQIIESRSVLQNQLRNAATPVAHKAQVALSSPKSMSINVNINAPKVWFPVSKNKSDGALYVDAGKLTLSLNKPEFLANMRWSMKCTGIHAKFRRSAVKVFKRLGKYNSSNNENDKNDIPIILPLDLNYEVERSGDGPATIKKKNGVEYSQSKVSKLTLSKICIKLVDVEVLAKAIGKWYASGLLQVKQKGEAKTSSGLNHNSHHQLKDFNSSHLSEELSITVEKVELHLQVQLNESLGSLRNFNKRTYLVEVANVRISRTENGYKRTSIGTLDYINIVRMKESEADSRRKFRPSLEPQHTVLRCLEKHLTVSRNYPQSTENAREANSSAAYSSKGKPNFLQEEDDGRTFATDEPGAIKIKFVHDKITSVDDLDVHFRYIESRVTTTTLRDCYGAIKEILEAIKIMTGEMERRIHETGRSTRREFQSLLSKSDTLNESIQSLHTDSEHDNVEESSLILKVSMEKIAFLVAGDIDDSNGFVEHPPIIQMLSSALIMFQSVENRDASGNKTFHISLNDYSACMSSQFEPLPPSRLSPIIDPVALDFRSVHTTENSGTVVAREVSISCDVFKSSVLVNDVIMMTKVIKEVVKEIRSFRSHRDDLDADGLVQQSNVKPQSRYLYKGSLIATTVNFQFQPFSIVLMKRHCDGGELSPLFDFRGEAYGKLEGCATALFGESRIGIASHFFSQNTSDWEYVLEPATIVIDFEQQPNDLVVGVSTSDTIKANITSDLVASLSEFITEFDRRNEEKAKDYTKRMEKHEYDKAKNEVSITNETGADFCICLMDMMKALDVDEQMFEDDTSFIRLPHGKNILLKLPESFKPDSDPKVGLILASESAQLIGLKKPIVDLPIYTSKESLILKISLIPKQNVTKAHYSFEPVVEWCMQNQRLRSACNNISSVDKGVDLLSNKTWSPSDRLLIQENEEHWLHPYLDGDVHEWTDMTGNLRMERDRVMLPDNKWIWANDWSVHLPGDNADADGWEYATDFKVFGHKSRSYKQGDTCRRRRWTRTRLMKPPRLDDPCRPMSLVWNCSRDINGNQMVKIISPLTVCNFTELGLSLFGFSHSWIENQLLGTVDAGDEFTIPLHLSSMTYLRLAVGGEKIHLDGTSNSVSMNEYSFSNYILVIPHSHESESIHHVSINPDYDKAIELNLPSNLHFTIKFVCSLGCTQIIINPIVRISNLLPCPLQFRLSEGAFDGAIDTQNTQQLFLEEQLLEVGMESSSFAVDVMLNPLVSFRVPGYRWSHKQRIVNRKCALFSWRPSIEDEEIQYKSGDLESNKDEHTTMIEFERLTYGGDPLTLVLEVVPGICPLLRIFAQYWVVDKTGFGLRFCDGFGDLLGTTLRTQHPRRSYLQREELQNEPFREDMEVDGHEFIIGRNGLTTFFSSTAKLAVSIDFGDTEKSAQQFRGIQSNWSQLVDISNVMPKAVFSVEEFQGDRRFDLSYDVTFAPSIFSRTKLVTIYNRFHLVNLSESPFYVSQDKSFNSTFVPPKSTVYFHWESKSSENKVRLSVDNITWTSGAVQLDTVGIIAMRLPSKETLPMVVQTEVRLAKNDHDAAVEVLIWYANDRTNPLYMLKNKSSQEIFCTQSNGGHNIGGRNFHPPGCGDSSSDSAAPVFDLVSNGFNCGLIETDFNVPENEHYNWNIKRSTTKYFGFDDPSKSHVIEWTCEELKGNSSSTQAKVEIDALGSSSVLTLSSGKHIGCTVRAERSTKVIEFFDISQSQDAEHPFIAGLKDKLGHHKSSLPIQRFTSQDSKCSEEEHVAFTISVEIAGVYISIVDNSNKQIAGREIFLVHIDSTMLKISHTQEGYDELELTVLSLQIDNHIKGATHAVMLSCPHFGKDEPFLHISAVRRLQDDNVTNVFRYVAFRMLAVDIALDRRTAEAIAQLMKPLETKEKSKAVNVITHIIKNASGTEQSNIHDVANIMTSRRIYIEQLHLHPIRVSFTFTQEWESSRVDSDKSMILQYIRKIPSLSNAELTFTSFVVSHTFESSDMLIRIIGTHYLSQLTKHFFSIIGSLAILNGPADFLANVGTGVRDFFYEPINGLVHGPDKFIEGLENGSLSLARGLFVGVVRGAANVTYVVNSNLANLTDEEFIDERNAHQRSITDSLSRGNQPRTMTDSLHIAGASIARGVKSGAIGLVDEPWQSFARQGPIGFVKGVGKALVGAIVKPVVGVGDGAVVVMNHMSEVTSTESAKKRIPKRLRRALPRKLSDERNSVLLVPYDDKAAKAQKIVTGNETKDDAYLCHVTITNHLVIASDKCLWIINRSSREPWCLNWEEISHFNMINGRIMQITIFSQTGLKPHTFEVDSVAAAANFSHLLSMQESKMGNSVCRQNASHEMSNILDLTSDILGVKSVQTKHVFGTVNNKEVPFNISSNDEIEVIENCFARVKHLGGELRNYFSSLDEESWALVSSWRYLFSGLNSRHCMVAGFINGAGVNIQIKATKLVQGGSPCYHIPTREYDEANCILAPGAAIIFFAWGSPPSLKYQGQIFMNIETNAFSCNLLNKKNPLTSIKALSGYSCTFLERSISEWWAKYWVLVKRNE